MRYSLKHRQALAEKAKTFEADPIPWDLSAELALMRTLLQDYLDRFQDGITMPAEDIERIFGMLETISRLVERVAKIINSTALTMAEVKYLQARIVDLLNTYVPDPDQRAKFVAELESSIGVRERGQPASYIDADR